MREKRDAPQKNKGIHFRRGSLGAGVLISENEFRMEGQQHGFPEGGKEGRKEGKRKEGRKRKSWRLCFWLLRKRDLSD